ncbi:Tubulin_tyrosine ligase-like 3 [Hexamita inflata]|uniref:Tubulin tyrosine ligase-like 3 n=1 Tax=Hexamita inflata TaxID=28002 RepID=A0AA86UHG4_9EUKA|nr:Tubulin tyrosine ligase-like 3 [Hexamita inflata]
MSNALKTTGQVSISFSPQQQFVYEFAATDLAYSLYSQILLMRPYWKQAQSMTCFNLMLTETPKPAETYKQLSTEYNIFNHLPGGNLLTDFNKMYKTVVHRLQHDAFSFLRVRYDLKHDRIKLLNHMLYIAHIHQLKPAEDFSYTSDFTIATPMLRSHSQAAHKKRTTNNFIIQEKTPVFQPALDQERENDQIWGHSTHLPEILSLTLPKEKKLSVQVQKKSTYVIYKNPQQKFIRQPLPETTKPISYVPAKEKIPIEFAHVDPQTSLANIWELTNGQQITMPQQVPDISCQNCTKVCEHVLKIHNRKITLHRFVLIRSNGDCYIYEKPLIKMDPIKRDWITPEREKDKFTIKNDSNYLTVKQFGDQLLRYGVNPSTVQNNILPNSENAVQKIIKVFRQELNLKVPCQNSFELFRFDFQIRSKLEGLGVYVVGIQSTPYLELESSYEFALYPKMLDDMYDIVLDQLFANPACKKEWDPIVAKEGQEEEDAIAKIPKAQRVICGLRFRGGRAENMFHKILHKWG